MSDADGLRVASRERHDPEDAKDVLAYRRISASHAVRIPLERPNKEPQRRSTVVGIFPSLAVLIHLGDLAAITLKTERRQTWRSVSTGWTGHVPIHKSHTTKQSPCADAVQRRASPRTG